jgi:ribosomal protein S12
MRHKQLQATTPNACIIKVVEIALHNNKSLLGHIRLQEASLVSFETREGIDLARIPRQDSPG